MSEKINDPSQESWADKEWAEGKFPSGFLEEMRKYSDAESYEIGSGLSMLESIVQHELPAAKETALLSLSELQGKLKNLKHSGISVSVPELETRMAAMENALK
jgi:hypothetical protein